MSLARATSSTECIALNKQPASQASSEPAPSIVGVSDVSAHDARGLWLTAAVIALALMLAFCGFMMVGVGVVSLSAIALGIMRLYWRERSFWRARSVALDAFLHIAFGIGLFATYISIRLLLM